MARKIKRADINLANGEVAILSTVEIENGYFETMLASPNFDIEYAVLRSETEAQAISDFNHLRKTYHVEPLSGKYAELAEALKKASADAVIAAYGEADGGTCNFDSPTLTLKGWPKAKVEQAAKAAGLRCFVWNCYGSKSYVFSVPVAAQANARTTAAEAMCKSLRTAGYDAGMYYQVD